MVIITGKEAVGGSREWINYITKISSTMCIHFLHVTAAASLFLRMISWIKEGEEDVLYRGFSSSNAPIGNPSGVSLLSLEKRFVAGGDIRPNV